MGHSPWTRKGSGTTGRLSIVQEYLMEKNSFFNKRRWKNWIFKCKRMKLEAYIIYLQKFLDTDLGNDFMSMT